MYHPPQLNLDEKDGLKLTVVNKWDSLLSNERFHIALQEFIYICYKYSNSGNIPIQTTHPDGSKGEIKNITFPYKNLYDKVFKYIVKLENETDISNENPQPVLDTKSYPQLLNIPRYEQINNDIIINKTSRSLFAEASYAFALFFTCKELAILSAFVVDKDNYNDLSLKNIINHTASLENIFNPISREVFKPCYPYYITSPKNNNVLSDCFYDRIIAVKGSNLQPEMYNNVLKKFLIEQKFKFNASKSGVRNSEIELYKLWNPYLYIGEVYDNTNVTEDYLYNGVPASHYTGLLFSFIARGGIVEGKFEYSFTRIKDIIKGLSTKMNEIVSTYCTCLYCSIFPLDKNTPQYTIISIGDGSSTLGLFNIPNLGVICFNYSFEDKYDKYQFKVKDTSSKEKMFYRGNVQEEIEIKKTLSFAKNIIQKKRIESIMLNNSSMLHFCCFGNDREDFTYIKSSKGGSGTTNDSYLDKLIYLKSNKNSNGFIPCEDISDNDIILEQDGKKQLYKLNGKTVAKYDNVFHDFYYIEKHPQSVNLFFSMDESNSTSVDEVFACVIVLDKFSDVVIQSSQMFKDDEFLVSKETSKIIEQKWIKEEQRDKILSILKKEKCTVSVTLNPCFVGKRYFNQVNNGYRVVDVDCNYIPHWDSVQKECNVLSAEDNERKHVYAQIKVTEESGKENISIEIYSFVSPLISNLNLQFKDNLSETVRESFNENYTLILKNYTVHSNKQNKDIPSYNQVLAMLRCLGFLEAICINISQDENFFENKEVSGSDSYFLYKKILKDAVCFDKTMEKRNLPPTDCQIKNPIYYHRDSCQESDFPDNTKPF